MSSRRLRKNDILMHEKRYGRNLAMRRAFNLSGGEFTNPIIGIVPQSKATLACGTFDEMKIS